MTSATEPIPDATRPERVRLSAELPGEPGSFTVKESKAHSEIAKGRLTPMKVGRRTLISFRAALAWERICERASSPGHGPSGVASPF
jgi:hypothetical protein